MYTYVWVAYFFVRGETVPERFEINADHEPGATEKAMKKIEIMEELSGNECIDYFIEDILEPEE